MSILNKIINMFTEKDPKSTTTIIKFRQLNIIFLFMYQLIAVIKTKVLPI